MPCRLVDATLPWSARGEYGDAGLLPRLIQAQANETLAMLCRAYDAAAIQEAALLWAAQGPERHIDLEQLLGDLDIELGDGP